MILARGCSSWLLVLAAQAVVPGHGPVSTNPTADQVHTSDCLLMAQPREP